MSTPKESTPPHRTQFDINNEMMCRLRAVSHNAALHEMVPVDNWELSQLIHAANKVIKVAPPAAPAKAGCDILHIIAADERLAKLSDKELIIEVLGTHAADYRCVSALMDRLLPNWQNLLTDEETENAKPAVEVDGPLGYPKP